MILVAGACTGAAAAADILSGADAAVQCTTSGEENVAAAGVPGVSGVSGGLSIPDTSKEKASPSPVFAAGPREPMCPVLAAGKRFKANSVIIVVDEKVWVVDADKKWYTGKQKTAGGGNGEWIVLISVTGFGKGKSGAADNYG